MGLGKRQTYFTAEDIEAGANKRLSTINDHFSTRIEDSDYPCVGAKSAIHTNQYRFGIYGQMGSEETTSALGEDLKTYIKETIDLNSQYMSMIAVFTDEVDSELDFEK